MTMPVLTRRGAMLCIAGSAAVLGTARATAATGHRVEIGRMKFGPAPAGLRVGDTILWSNRDVLRHTATARDGSFDIDLEPGAEAQVTLGRAGEVAVYCRYHPGMKLTLVIGAA